MSGAGKVLTVSYGTFLCTFEGFDKPFAAMNAVADYFHDLTADSRYYNTGRPDPDVEVLAKIAGSKAECRVDVKIVDDGVILSCLGQTNAANAPKQDDGKISDTKESLKDNDGPAPVLNLSNPQPASERDASGDSSENTNNQSLQIGSSLSPEDEAELQAELAEIEKENVIEEYINPALDRGINATIRADRASRVMHAESGAEDEVAVARLLDEANVKLGDEDNTRRQSELSHLRAAMAATVADQKFNPSLPKSGFMLAEPYRIDLADAVTPDQSDNSDGTESDDHDDAAPLLLASAQRIKRKTAAKEQVTKKTQSHDANIDETATDAAPSDTRPAVISGQDKTDKSEGVDSVKKNINFANFVKKIGATEVSELLEAAAAYSTFVKGRPRFARPQLMRQVAVYLGKDAYDREECLQSFGWLLRHGKIIKVKRGLFEIPDSTQFNISIE